MPSSHENSDRRRFPRAIFSVEDGITGVLSIPGIHEKALSARILNLSEGGLQFSLDEKDKMKIHKGDRIVLLQIKAPSTLKFLMNIDAEVKWVLSNDVLELAGAGCAFINLSAISREQIAGFVEAWTESGGR